MLLHANPASNLGWRILLAGISDADAKNYVRVAAQQNLPLSDVLPDDLKAGWLLEAEAHAVKKAEEPAQAVDSASPKIVLTSYEGSKGRSAQYVVLVGLHDNELPRQPAAASDIEICKFLVGLTRTKKQCTILATRRFGNLARARSSFIGGIRNNRFRRIEVTKAFWAGK